MNEEIRADLIVCGAGTAGAVAAIAAADQGIDALVVDQFGCAGGSATNSFVTPMMNSGVPGNPHCSYVGEEINRRMVGLGAAAGDGKVWFDPEALKFVLEEMLTERGVRRLYHSFICGAEMDGRRVTGVTAANKSGLVALRGKAFLDATGDADLCARLGLPVMHGNETDGANQPVSLRYILGGVDLDAFWEQIQSMRPDGSTRSPRPENFDGAVTNSFSPNWALSPLFQKAIAAGDLMPMDAAYWQYFTIPGRCDALALNCPEFFDFRNADDAETLTRVQIDGKRAVMRQLSFYKKYLKGFEKAYVSAVAPMVGVRESRRAVTEYVLTHEDCARHARFEDAILRTNYAIDVHGKVLKNERLSDGDAERPYYEIPLRSLIVRDAENLLAAGRNLGADFIAQSSARIIPSCRAMGEAAGIAAAMYVKEKARRMAEIDGARVRAEMERRGADFGAM